MKNFQEFIRYANICKKNYEDMGSEALDVHIKGNKKKYYKKIGVTNEQKIAQFERRKTKEQFDRIDLSTELINEYGSVYEISDDVKRYILLNKPPTDREIIRKLHLPFRSIFIETEITHDDVEIGVPIIKGVMINTTKMVSDKVDSKGVNFTELGRIFMVQYLCLDNDRYYIDEFKIDVDKTNKDVKIFYDDKKTLKFLTDFIMNFLLFINDPEVELITISRDSKQRAKRIKKGKMPLPSSRKVRLVGKLKKYLYSFGSGFTKGKLNYRFWVRGHSRTLTSAKWKKSMGKIIFISPYKKGEGLMLKRTYSLDFEKKDVRYKEMKEGFLDYEDI